MTDPKDLTGVAPQHFMLRHPSFTASSDVWRTDRTRMKVARGGAVLGNLVWTDLPQALTKGAAYQLKLDWTLQTTASSVNLHLRDPKTGKFRVIGKIEVPDKLERMRTDTIIFRVPESGLSQFMLGAVHFTGRNAGAEIRSVELDELSSKDSPIPASSASSQSFAGKAHTLAMEDYERRKRSYKHARSLEGVSGARARMIFHAHAIEKGLSRSNFRASFGKVAVPGLAKEMNAWLSAGRDIQDPFLQSSAAVMKSYFERHALLKKDISHYRQLFSEPAQEIIDSCTHQEGGVLPANQLREVPRSGEAERSFMGVMYGRRSVREFIRKPVSDVDIARAVQIAMQAPSVCNRQGARVHQLTDPQIIESVLDIQGGFSGYKMPPRLLLITADLDAFLFAAERHQPFVDGGLFMMSLLLGLTQVGLGSCSLNTAMGSEKENSIRKIINIPDHEVFICFVAVGHYDEKVLVPRSKRTDVSDVLVRHGRS